MPRAQSRLLEQWSHVSDSKGFQMVVQSRFIPQASAVAGLSFHSLSWCEYSTPRVALLAFYKSLSDTRKIPLA